LANAHKIIGIKQADSMNEIVANSRPLEASVFVPDMVAHTDSPRRKDRHVRASLSLQPELGFFEALAYLIVADIGWFEHICS